MKKFFTIILILILLILGPMTALYYSWSDFKDFKIENREETAQVLGQKAYAQADEVAKEYKEEEQNEQSVKSALSPEALFYDQRFLELKEIGVGLEYTQQYPIILHEGPEQAKNFQATDRGDGRMVTLSWQAFNTPPVQIEIYRSQTAGLNGEAIALLAGTVFGFHDEEIEIGRVYYYKLLISDSKGRKTASRQVKAGPIKDILKPKSPENINIELLEDEAAIKISWTNPSDLDFWYIKIYRSQESGDKGMVIFPEAEEIEINRLKIDQEIARKIENNIFIDSNIEANQYYYYTLISVDKHFNESVSVLPRMNPGNPNLFAPPF